MPGRFRGDDGASAVEYGLIVFAIAAVIAATVFLFGKAVADTYQQSCDTIDSQVSSGNC